MKKLKINCLALLAASMLVTQAEAASVSINPSASLINVGQSMSVDVVISNLGGSYVGAFEFDLNYDTSVLTFNSYNLTDNLGDITPDVGNAEDWSLVDNGFGFPHIAELSYWDDLDDFSLQGDSFTLATIYFTGSGVGSSGLSFDSVLISDELGDEIATSLTGGSVDVSPVPEPSTLILFGFGLTGLMAVRKKKKALSA